MKNEYTSPELTLVRFESPITANGMEGSEDTLSNTDRTGVYTNDNAKYA